MGVRAGLLSAAATAGALAGFGMRHGDPSGPFAMLGDRVLASLGAMGPGATTAMVAGVAAHAAWMIAWGLCFATLAHRRPFVTTVTIAALLALLSLLFARSWVPSAMGAVGLAPIPRAQVILCVLLMAAGFLAGRVSTSGGVTVASDHAPAA